VKFYAFHLMPYADLDLSYSEKYDSAWVTLPRRYFDRIRGHELYNRYLDELEYADHVGFDGVSVNEHHQNAYGLMPIPEVIAGALSRRVRGKLLVLGRALPLLNNPLVVAESYAMLDEITGGRLIAGFVRGIGAEYHSWGVNPTESHDRFHEAHDLIIRAWTSEEPFAFEGKYYDFEYVNTWPKVYQQPHPPIWIPSQGSSETIQWSAKKRYTYLQTFSPIATVRRYMEMYKVEAEKNGYTATSEQLGWSVPIYVAETDEKAREEARPHIEAFVNKFLRMPVELLLPPGYTSVASMKGVMQAKAALSGGPQKMEDLLERGTFICGSPHTVREAILRYQQEIGFGHLLPNVQFGTLPHDLTMKNIELLGTEVIPFLRERIEPGIPLPAAKVG
jgi:alkanesulfonate monooxygenase SsuD/methylene tetrahydromethanopterin reductase-like flavin-dependent oxidoreductase (luciferase family)